MCLLITPTLSGHTHEFHLSLRVCVSLCAPVCVSLSSDVNSAAKYQWIKVSDAEWTEKMQKMFIR